MQIYFRPHANRLREQRFFQTLLQQCPDAEHTNDNFPIPADLLKKPVLRDDLAGCLERETLLPEAARQRCLSALQDCPAEMFVLGETGSISVDMVVVQGERIRFIEFHEKQHRRLSDKSPKRIYDRDGKGFEVPRGLQRLVRDVWRCLYLESFSVVWWDWFEKNVTDFVLPSEAGFHEFTTPGKFCFADFLSSYPVND